MRSPTSRIFAFALLLCLSRLSTAAVELIDGPILPGFGDDYTEEANGIVEEVILQGARHVVDNTKRYTPGVRVNARSRSPEQCLHGHVSNGHTLATFATAGGLRNLYKWVRGHAGWAHTFNYHHKSALLVAIDYNLLYMAKDIWSHGHPFAYNRTSQLHFGNRSTTALSYMMEKHWPLRGFEAAWDAGERFSSGSFISYGKSKTKYKRDDIIGYLRDEETNPENNTRLQTLINKFEAFELTKHARLTDLYRVNQDEHCSLLSGISNGINSAIDKGILNEKVAMSFNIHGLPLLHYLVSFNIVPAVKKALQQEYGAALALERDITGRDGLITAIEAHNIEIARMLLDIKPDLATTMIPDKDGYKRKGDSPLHFAIRKGVPVNIIKLLLERSNRALLTYQDAAGYTPASLLEYLHDDERISGERYLAVRRALKN
ncbi:ankyrin repeat domain-containing protein [Parendozoicomonas sp. Alg238-R29]|uniref:ankyrin repeat domain-containing protein n=1 Tax=Parendozoicomonas sp. Alg238-R29 TaxID=2993446 RepID=UPI00248E1C03|nr:ankyrin repeat domain-containing protein [Parendozoicomonas sp. Alg238-R29]